MSLVLCLSRPGSAKILSTVIFSKFDEQEMINFKDNCYMALGCFSCCQHVISWRRREHKATDGGAWLRQQHRRRSVWIYWDSERGKVQVRWWWRTARSEAASQACGAAAPAAWLASRVPGCCRRSRGMVLHSSGGIGA